MPINWTLPIIGPQTVIVFDTRTIDSDICLDYPKIISEKWNLAVNFNCQGGKIIPYYKFYADKHSFC